MHKPDDGEVWPENGSLNYSTILQLTLFCKGLEKWDETPYIDLLFDLRNYYEIRKKCELLTDDSNVMFVLTDKRNKAEKL